MAPMSDEHAPQPPDSRMSPIARRAHEIYEARGGEHGKATAEWLAAEREIDADIEQTDDTRIDTIGQ